MRTFENFLNDENLDRLNLEAKVTRLKGLIAQIGEGYRRGGEKIKRLPVDASCRVMMEPFKQIYGEREVEKDRAFVKRKEEEWREKGAAKGEESIGERFELLKTAVFNKYLGDKFVIVRSSLYDDYKNGVDNVLLDIENGNVVCAFDEVGDDSLFRKQKEEKVAAKNLEEGGASLKYGIGLREGKLIAARLENLPIFCLSLSQGEIKEGIQKMDFSKNKKSEIEDKIFETCLRELLSQISTLRKKLPEAIAGADARKAADLRNLSERLDLFEESITSATQSKPPQAE